MSLRFSTQEALKKGWITQAQARETTRLEKVKSAPSRGRSPSPAERKTVLTQTARAQMPQEKLWDACAAHWPDRVSQGELVWEFSGAVPGRRFRIDIAFVPEKVGIEVDGWEHHGKYLADFKRDREKDRCLVLNGWRVLRFYAEEIRNRPELLISQIERVLSLLDPQAEHAAPISPQESH